MLRVIFFCIIGLLCFGCQYIREETCKDSVRYYEGIGFNIVILDEAKRDMDFYEVYALDRLSNRDTLIRIDRVFATFNEFWNYGDTLVKERGTTTVTLRKRDSIFGTDVFVTEWTCEHGLITNGEPHSVWVERVEKFRRRHPTGRWDFGKYNQED
jgi:hypothetical protein